MQSACHVTRFYPGNLVANEYTGRLFYRLTEHSSIIVFKAYIRQQITLQLPCLVSDKIGKILLNFERVCHVA